LCFISPPDKKRGVVKTVGFLFEKNIM